MHLSVVHLRGVDCKINIAKLNEIRVAYILFPVVRRSNCSGCQKMNRSIRVTCNYDGHVTDNSCNT